MENINFKMFIKGIFETLKSLFNFKEKIILFLWSGFIFLEIFIVEAFYHKIPLKIFNFYKSFFSIFMFITIVYLVLKKIEYKKNIFNLFLISGGVFIGNVIVIIVLLLITVIIYTLIYIVLTLTGSNHMGIYNFLKEHFVLSGILFLTYLTFYQYIIIYPIGKAFVEGKSFWDSFKIIVSILKPSNLKKLLFDKKYFIYMLGYGSFVFFCFVLISVLIGDLTNKYFYSNKILTINSLLFFSSLNQFVALLLDVCFINFLIFSYFYVKDSLELKNKSNKLEHKEKKDRNEEKEIKNDIV